MTVSTVYSINPVHTCTTNLKINHFFTLILPCKVPLSRPSLTTTLNHSQTGRSTSAVRDKCEQESLGLFREGYPENRSQAVKGSKYEFLCDVMWITKAPFTHTTLIFLNFKKASKENFQTCLVRLIRQFSCQFL